MSTSQKVDHAEDTEELDKDEDVKEVELRCLEEPSITETTRESVEDKDEEQPIATVNQDRQIRDQFKKHFKSYQWKPPCRIGNLFFFLYSRKYIEMEPEFLTLVPNQKRKKKAVMVPFICLPYIWMTLSSIPIMIITALMAWMQITGTMAMTEISFWKFKFLHYLLIAYAIYSVVRILTTNPGVSEKVFYEMEVNEKRRYAIQKLREDGLLQGESNVDDIISGMEGSSQDQPNSNTNPRRMCGHCQIKLEGYITHCGICGICVEDLDHHCVFFGKCISRDNLYYFNCAICLFLVTVGYFVVLNVLNGVWVGHRSHHNLQHYKKQIQKMQDPFDMINNVQSEIMNKSGPGPLLSQDSFINGDIFNSQMRSEQIYHPSLQQEKTNITKMDLLGLGGHTSKVKIQNKKGGKP